MLFRGGGTKPCLQAGQALTEALGWRLGVEGKKGLNAWEWCAPDPFRAYLINKKQTCFWISHYRTHDDD